MKLKICPAGFHCFILAVARLWYDGVNWNGAGSSGIITITFPNVAARYIRVVQTGGVCGLFWSIHEFDFFGVPRSTASLQINFEVNAGGFS